jgi:phenylpropionate dioxygenase-like ring-hydroxylating dioxygenase large terminal subunit
VQRFGQDLRGFENVCAHRFYPLHTKDKGNGPIRCGFHHWQYNKDGLAVGIPKCQELYGVSPRELDARLEPVEIATCGILIFGRFPTAEKAETLEQFLGVGFDILQTMCNLKGTLYRLFSNIAANWKLGFYITLDDYHIVAVHPDTFGKRGYLPTEVVHYYRFGQHSAFFCGADDSTLEKMAADCRCGSYRPIDYRILQFFPNLVVVHFKAARNWFVLVQQYVPLSLDRTHSRKGLPSAVRYGRKSTWLNFKIRPH